MLDFFDIIAEGFEFIIAFGSIMGFLGFIIGLLGWMVLGQFQSHKMIGVMVVSIILLGVCGTFTRLKYFHIY
ncbi:MAG TPA: hypothetical protein ENH98_02195 [archaeon]|nr:hypothetical protein [archaeon]